MIDDGFHAGGCGGDVLGGKAGRIIGHLAGESDDAVFGADVDGGGFQKRVGIEFGFNAGGEGVVAGLVAGGREQEKKRKRCEL